MTTPSDAEPGDTAIVADQVAKALCDRARKRDPSVIRWEDASADVRAIYLASFTGFVEAIESVGFHIVKRIKP